MVRLRRRRPGREVPGLGGIRFETSGWDELELIKVGEWVALNKGFTDQDTRRRLFGAESGLDPITMEELHAEDHLVELQEREKVARNVQIGLTQGAPNNGYVQVFNTQTAQSENIRIEDVRKLDDREKRELDKDSVMGQLPGLLGATLGMLAPPFRQLTTTGASRQVGDLVVCDNLLYVVKEARRDSVVVEANGYSKEVEWGRIQPANNWTGTVGRGEYVWILEMELLLSTDDRYVLYCVAYSTGEVVKVYSAMTGEPRSVPLQLLHRMGPNTTLQGNQAFGRFALACAEDVPTSAVKFRPGIIKGLVSMIEQLAPDREQISGSAELSYLLGHDQGRTEGILPQLGDEKTPENTQFDMGFHGEESGMTNWTAEHARNAEALQNMINQDGGRVMDWEPGEPGAPDDPAATPTGPYKTTYLIAGVVGAAVVVYVITR